MSDHNDEARRVGLALHHTTRFIVGSPTITTPVIEDVPLAAVDLPVRVAAWEDGYHRKVNDAVTGRGTRR